jgi:hypothetical protein
MTRANNRTIMKQILIPEPELTPMLVPMRAPLLERALALVMPQQALALALGLPYVERFMHHVWGNIIVPQCIICESTARTGTPPK